ncbi:MAG: hypothetical protein KDC92_17165 [Bacteroidetes bacterium]|nr:hypothetical protein [Bacteroidota bacterium]
MQNSQTTNNGVDSVPIVSSGVNYKFTGISNNTNQSSMQQPIFQTYNAQANINGTQPTNPIVIQIPDQSGIINTLTENFARIMTRNTPQLKLDTLRTREQGLNKWFKRFEISTSNWSDEELKLYLFTLTEPYLKNMI